jgi:chemotaxis protein MotB
MKRFFILIATAALATSCVTTRQYNSLRAELISAQNRLDYSRSMLDEYTDRNDGLARLNTQSQTEIATLNEKLTDLQERYNRLLDSGQANNSQHAQEMQKTAARMAELEQAIAARDRALNDLRRKVAGALTGFDGKGLSVTTREGKVYVSMDDKLLFRSGSFDIDPAGAQAIDGLASVLAANPDIEVMVEGHTDDVPYRGNGHLQDNLDLSAKRATTVTRLILLNKDIDPARVISAGRGEWLPLTLGTSTDARAQNRRTEIILTPKLDELLNIVVGFYHLF